MNHFLSTQGTWYCPGYNRIMKISNDEIILYVTCSLGSVELTQMPIGEAAQTYHLEILSDDEIILFQDDDINRYTYTRIHSIPEPVYNPEDTPVSDPVLNFDFFWQYFKENYAFFELREVDWDKIKDEIKPDITKNTDQEKLLRTFTEMIWKLNDLHVSIHTENRIISSCKDLNPTFNQWMAEENLNNNNVSPETYMQAMENGFTHLIQHLSENIFIEPPQLSANNRVLWGKVKPNIGYLFVSNMGGFEDKSVKDYGGEIPALKAALDEIIPAFQDLDGVIIDARFNPGGEDVAALSITNRFTDKKRTAFTKTVKHQNGENNHQEIKIFPEGEIQFTKPVLFLTSQSTISAAEIWTLSVMPLPHVTRMGDRTQGVLSDVLGMVLPNGWYIGMSNEVYTASDGKLYEKTGIPPQIEEPPFGSGDFYHGLVEMLEKAVSQLEKIISEQ